MAEPHRTEPHRRRPISRHPLFPAIVALWFGTLLALGTLALRTPLIENLVLTARIDSLVPAAAPPLGVTARLLLALAVGLAGGAIGWVLARRMAAPQEPLARQVFAVGNADLHPDDQWPGVAAPQPQPVAVIEPAPVLDPGPLLDPALFLDPAPLLDPVGLLACEGEATDAAPECVPIAAEPEPEPAPSLVERPSPVRPMSLAEERIVTADLDSLSHVELVERLAIALRRRQERLATIEAGAPAGVIRFPNFAERHGPHAVPPAEAARSAPRETEKALREALATLKRMSGG